MGVNRYIQRVVGYIDSLIGFVEGLLGPKGERAFAKVWITSIFLGAIVFLSGYYVPIPVKFDFGLFAFELNIGLWGGVIIVWAPVLWKLARKGLELLDLTLLQGKGEQGPGDHEVELKSSEPNGLTTTLKGIIDSNLNDPYLYEEAKNWNFTAGVKETSTGVISTINFDDGKVSMQNGDPADPDVKLEADFETLAEVGSGGLSTGLKAILTGDLGREGSFFDLIKVQKILSA